MNKVLKFCFRIYHYIQVFFLRVFSRTFSKGLNFSCFSRVLVISPHPDDEAFGCGGLMQSLIQSGNHVELIVLSKGEAVHKHCCPDDEERIVRTRAELTDRANSILGVDSKSIHRLDFPDGGFASVKNMPDMLNELDELIKKISPSLREFSRSCGCNGDYRGYIKGGFNPYLLLLCVDMVPHACI